MTADNLSQRASELSQRLDELQAKCASNPANAPEVLSDALESLQSSLEELSTADEELMQQNATLIESQEALGKERAFTSTVLDTMGTPLVVLDRYGKVTRFNHACEQITGYSFMEVKDKVFWDIFLVPEEKDRIIAGFVDLCAGNFPIPSRTIG